MKKSDRIGTSLKENTRVEDVVFPFGKYRGHRVGDIAKKDRDYLKWSYANLSNIPDYLYYTIEYYLGKE